MKKKSSKTTRVPARRATKNAAKGVTTTPKEDPKKMNPQLDKECGVIRGLLVASDIDTMKARCEIGLHVALVMRDVKKYGKNALRKLAAALDRDADTLYDFAKVATLVQEESFSKLVRERSEKHQMPLSFSHWVVLAKSYESAREDLARKALKEGWSVRLLKEAAKPEKNDVGQDYVTRLSTMLTSTKSTMDKNLPEVVTQLSAPDVAPERLVAARQLRDLLQEVQDAAARGIDELEHALELFPDSGEEQAPSAQTEGEPERPPAAGSPVEVLHRM